MTKSQPTPVPCSTALSPGSKRASTNRPRQSVRSAQGRVATRPHTLTRVTPGPTASTTPQPSLNGVIRGLGPAHVQGSL
jgi:hypothetical protein